MSTIGTIRGQIVLNVQQAIAGYAAVRAANAATTYALSRSSAVFLATGKAMVGAGILLAAGFGIAIKAAAEFEKQLDFFGAVSGSTEEQMERVRVKALQLGQDTRFSAGQIADSFVELGKAGVTAEEIVDGVGEAVANLGAAADIPLERAAQIMTAAVQTFELGAQDAVHVADLLAGAANASIVEIEDLGVSLKYVGGVAASISIPIEDVIDALALLGKYGIRGSTAGTSLRQILVSLSGTSKKASGVLKDLGIITADGANKFFDATGKAKPLAEIFQVLQDHTEGLTEAQRLAAFKIIFNNRALAAASVLAREGAAGFATMNKEISKTTAAEVAAKRLDNLAGDVEILRGNIETLLITAGTPFQEFLRGIVQGAIKLVQWFTNLDASTQTLILKIMAFSAAGLLILGTFNLVIGSILRFADILMRLGHAFRLVLQLAIGLGKGLLLLGRFLLLTPFGLVITGIMLLVAAFIYLWNNSEAFRNFWIGLWEKIKSVTAAVVAWFQGLPAWFSQAWNNIRNAFISGWEAVVTFFTITIPGWFTNLVTTVQTTLETWRQNILTFFASLPGIMGGWVSTAVNAVVNFFAQLPYRVGFALGFLLGAVIRIGSQIIAAVIVWATQTYNTVVNWFQLLPGRVATFFSDMYNRANTWLINFTNSVRTNIINAYNAAIQWLQQLPGRVATFFSQMYSRANSWLVNFTNSVRTNIINAYNAVIQWLQQLPGRVGQFFSNMYTTANGRLVAFTAAVRSWASGIITTVQSWLSRLPGVVSGAINNAIQAFRDMVGRAFSAAASFAKGLWDGFKAGLGISSPSYIERAMWAITDVVGKETKNLAGQVRAIQTLGDRLQDIPMMEPNEQTLTTGYATSLINNLARQANDLRRLDEQLRRDAAWSSRAIDVRNDLMLQGTANLTAPPFSGTLRIAQDQLDELGKTINVDLTAYNPVEEKTSETATKELTKAAALGVFS